MATPRKLNQEQEREVALLYLCGVDTEQIKQQYGVSDATTRGNIVGKRSSEWNDLLIEFYSQKKPYDKGRNATHLYFKKK